MSFAISGSTLSSNALPTSLFKCRPAFFKLLLLLMTTLPIFQDACCFEDFLSVVDEVEKDILHPLPFAVPNRSLYLPTEKFLRRVRELTDSCPFAFVASVHGSSPPHDQEPLQYVTLTAQKGYVKGHLMRTRTRILAVFGESARELVTSHVALALIEAVCANQSDAASRQLAEVVLKVLDIAEIVLVPLANPSGRKMVEYGSRCETHNANDVDLNQNWDCNWNTSMHWIAMQSGRNSSNPLNMSALQPASRGGDYEDEYISKQSGLSEHDAGSKGDLTPVTESGSRNKSSHEHTYLPTLNQSNPVNGNRHDPRRFTKSVSGPAPFSEHETRALRVIAEQFMPSAYISVQSGGVIGITGPTDCGTNTPESEADLARLAAISNRVSAVHCPLCSYLPRSKLVGETLCGSGADYAYEKLRIPFVYTWRIFANADAAEGDCFRAANPVTRSAFEKVTVRWSHALLTLSKAVHDWRTVESSAGYWGAMQNATRAVMEDRKSRWKYKSHADIPSHTTILADVHSTLKDSVKHGAESAPMPDAGNASLSLQELLQRTVQLPFIDENNAVIGTEIIRDCGYAAATLSGLAIGLYAIRIAALSRRRRRRRLLQPDVTFQDGYPSAVDNYDKIL